MRNLKITAELAWNFAKSPGATIGPWQGGYIFTTTKGHFRTAGSEARGYANCLGSAPIYSN